MIDPKFGGKALQRMDLHFQPGRLAFHHNRDVSDTITATIKPAATLQTLVAISNANSTANCVATSMDGRTWTIRTATQRAWGGLCWNTSLKTLVAVSDSYTMISSDGITWSETQLPAPLRGGGWGGVAWSPTLGIYAASAGGAGFTSGKIMTSTDGINWTQQTTPASVVSQSFNDITWSDRLSMFVACNGLGSYGSILFSTDGVNWSALATYGAHPGYNTVYKVMDGNSYLLSVGGIYTGQGLAVYSTSGGFWPETSITGSDGGTNLRGTAYSPTLDLFVSSQSSSGSNQGFFRMTGSSAPGTWTRAADPTGRAYYRTACWSAALNKFVFMDANAGHYDSVTSSADGITWTTGDTMPSAIAWAQCVSTEIP
jgi:hypothetical protein